MHLDAFERIGYHEKPGENKSVACRLLTGKNEVVTFIFEGDIETRIKSQTAEAT
jgi:hypothetical protein